MDLFLLWQRINGQSTEKENAIKREYALEKAAEIGKLITSGVERLGLTAMKELPLMAWLPFLALGANLKAGKGTNFDSLKPRVYEILIYGSVARGSEEVGDIDLIVLDNGFFSNFFTRKPESDEADWYGLLSDNLRLLLLGWLGYSEEQMFEVVSIVNSDLHVLPLKMLRSRSDRSQIAKKHHDPRFLQNAFSAIWRFDGHQFVPTDIEYLERRYSTNLPDLRN